MDAKAETAMDGVWKKGPGVDLFSALDRVSPLSDLIQQCRLKLGIAQNPSNHSGDTENPIMCGKGSIKTD